MFIFKTRKKTNEELYEGWMRNDFSSTKKYAIALTFENMFSLLLEEEYYVW
jgi:hypothetical protein